MSETDHQSFYEIQLNTSHLLLVFLGAVVVGVTLFYLGVVIGRGQGTPTALAGDWEEAAPVEGTAGDAGAGEGEELGFYEEIRQEAGDPVASDAGPAGSAGTTSDPGGTSTGDSDATSTGEPDSATADESGTAGPTGPEEPVAEAPEPRSTGSDAVASFPEADPGLDSGWVIQVRSTTDRSQADTLTRALVVDGYQAFVVPAEIDGTTWYRVRVGRYRSRDDAETVERRLARRGDIEQTWVTEG